MWAILKLILDKNNSQAWRKINSIMGLYNQTKGNINSAKTTYKGAVDNSGMYGAFGG